MKDYLQMEVMPNENSLVTLLFRKTDEGWVAFPYLQDREEEDLRLQENMVNGFFSNEVIWNVATDIPYQDWENDFIIITNNIEDKEEE